MSTKARAKKEARKAAKIAKKEARKNEGDLTEIVFLDGERRTVRRAQRFSMRALPVELQSAVVRFVNDYESAFECLSAPALGVKVDGGGIHQADTRRLAAQQRIANLEQFIGGRAYNILVAVVINGVNAETLEGVAVQKCDVGFRIRSIIADVAEFYSRTQPRDRILEAARTIIEAAEYGSDRVIIDAEERFRREVGRRFA